MLKPEEINIIVDRAKIVSLLTVIQMRKFTLKQSSELEFTLKQSSELERLLTKERNGAIQNGVTDLDIILGYYLIGLDGYLEECYYPRE